VRRFDHPSADQHAFEKTVRIALEIVSVFERARLSLVAVNGHQAWRGLRPHERPFAAGRKSCATESSQSGVADDLDDLVTRASARDAIGQQRVAALLPIS